MIFKTVIFARSCERYPLGNIKNVVHSEKCLEKLRKLAFEGSRAQLHGV